MEAHRLQTAVCPDCLPIPLQHIPRNPGECYQWQLRIMEAPVKLTTSGRGKLTTCFAGEDSYVHVC